jgi:hypothetical protein
MNQMQQCILNFFIFFDLRCNKMKMEIKYQLFENENLFVQKYTGNFSIEKYIEYTRFITEYIKSKSIRKVLVDFRDLNFLELAGNIPDDYGVILDRVIEIRKDVNKNELADKDISLVIIVDKPIPTVIAHLFVNNFSNYKYCSTASNVLKILKLPKHLNNLDDILNNLECKFKNI